MSEARLLEVMARTNLNLGLYTKARSLAERSLEMHRVVLGPRHPDTLLSLNLRGVAALPEGNLQTAEQSFPSRSAVVAAARTGR